MLTDLAQSLGIAGAVTTAGLGVLSAVREGGPKEAQRIGASLGLGPGGWGRGSRGGCAGGPVRPFHLRAGERGGAWWEPSAGAHSART